MPLAFKTPIDIEHGRQPAPARLRHEGERPDERHRIIAHEGRNLSLSTGYKARRQRKDLSLLKEGTHGSGVGVRSFWNQSKAYLDLAVIDPAMLVEIVKIGHQDSPDRLPHICQMARRGE